MTKPVKASVQGCLRTTGLCAAPARRPVSRPEAAKGSGPRTRLAFLQQVVRKALAMPNTGGVPPPHNESTAVVRSSSSEATPVAGGKRDRDETDRIPFRAFTAYPPLPPGSTKQPQGSTVLYKDDTCVLVNDAYPKSTVHCLVMPTDLTLRSLNDLTHRHVDLLEHLDQVANRYVHFLREFSPRLYGRRRFITGFHALPSLPMLHMHLVSLDLDSPCLKTKKHYNSFATFFFLTSNRVIDDLKQNGYVTLNQDVKRLLAMEEQPMKCQWCGTPLSTIPELKRHLGTCPSNQSLAPQGN